ncbi:hypothetical protein ACRAWF_29495 [Streptomyces sp. L7]
MDVECKEVTRAYPHESGRRPGSHLSRPDRRGEPHRGPYPLHLHRTGGRAPRCTAPTRTAGRGRSASGTTGTTRAPLAVEPRLQGTATCRPTCTTTSTPSRPTPTGASSTGARRRSGRSSSGDYAQAYDTNFGTRIDAVGPTC